MDTIKVLTNFIAQKQDGSGEHKFDKGETYTVKYIGEEVVCVYIDEGEEENVFDGIEIPLDFQNVYYEFEDDEEESY